MLIKTNVECSVVFFQSLINWSIHFRYLSKSHISSFIKSGRIILSLYIASFFHFKSNYGKPSISWVIHFLLGTGGHTSFLSTRNLQEGESRGGGDVRGEHLCHSGWGPLGSASGTTKLAPQEGLALRLGIKKSKIKQLVRLTPHMFKFENLFFGSIRCHWVSSKEAG